MIDRNIVEDERIHQARTVRTVAKFKQQWFDNVKANSCYIKKNISTLWMTANPKNGISIAAGPSLKEDINKIKEIKNSHEIIVVDAALKFCLENGVIPDYVISTDCRPEIIQMFDNCGILPTKLILNVIANPEINTVWKNEIYWFVMMNQFYDLDNKEMIQTMHAVASKIGSTLMPGGNVSSVALSFMLSVRNVNQLLLFGHDFCWKEDMYCGGQMKNLEKEKMENELKAGTIFETVNTKGEKVITNLSLQRYAIWHEDIAKTLKGRLINCTDSSILKI